MPSTTTTYIGRFAPSPTGPLHFGSLVAAVGSFLQARQRNGQWLVRMEDLDPPREMPGAADAILRALETYSLYWDGPVLYQSERTDAYEEALERLSRDGLVYRCTCSRKQIASASAAAGLTPGIYPGTCRNRGVLRREPHALRVMTTADPVEFRDPVQGRHSHHLAREVGDFVLRRRDGLYAYQLAVVVDDGEQGVTEVVRGSDLLDSTPRQIHLQRLLELSTPAYLHLPVALDAAGKKLSKQTHAPALDLESPLPTLVEVLHFLGQHPPLELLEGDVAALWRWAVANWRIDRIPRQQGIQWRPGATPHA